MQNECPFVDGKECLDTHVEVKVYEHCNCCLMGQLIQELKLIRATQ